MKPILGCSPAQGGKAAGPLCIICVVCTCDKMIHYLGPLFDKLHHSGLRGSDGTILHPPRKYNKIHFFFPLGCGWSRFSL